MPVQALVLVPLAIRVDDFSGAARTRASYWAVGNSLLTNSWTSHPPTRLMLKGATWNGLCAPVARAAWGPWGPHIKSQMHTAEFDCEE